MVIYNYDNVFSTVLFDKCILFLSQQCRNLRKRRGNIKSKLPKCVSCQKETVGFAVTQFIVRTSAV